MGGGRPPERPLGEPGDGLAEPGVARADLTGRARVGLVAMALVAAVAIVWALAANWSKVSAYDWNLSPAWLFVGIVAVLSSYLVNGMTYVRSVEWLSPAFPPRRVALSIWGRSLLGRYIPGTVMMLVGRAVMAARWGVSKRTTVAATIYEQLLGIGIGAMAAVAYVGLYGNPGNPQMFWLLMLLPIGLVALHPRLFRPLSAALFRMVRRPPLDQTFTGRQIARILAGYLVGAALISIGVWALARSAAGPQIGGPLEVSLAFLLAFVVSTVAFIVPSGLGVRDALLAVLLARNLDGGPGGPALAVAVGLRFALLALELGFVGIATWMGRHR